ncbi:MAG: chemotaxis protein CheW [Nitriliruptoraceae bacterium]
MSNQYCSFQLAHLTFGIEVERVQEVMRSQTLTKVPLADPVVRGLINLRGQIVTALDLRRRLELPEPGAEHQPMNIVVRTAAGELSLLVDAIGDVVDVDDEDFERPPETLEGVARELITGAYKLPDRLLLVLDTDRAVELPAAA